MSFVWQFCLVVLLTITSHSNAVASLPLTIITEDWPPYNYIENNVLKGFSTELVELVMKDLNIKDKITVLPGPRAMKVLNKSKRTLFFSMIMTPERKPRYKWIGPFGEQAIYFYKKKGSTLKINSLEDAKKAKSVCARESGLVSALLKTNGFTNIDAGVSPESIYLRVILDRCELGIGETPQGVHFWLKKMNQPLDSLLRTNVKLISSPLYIVTSKDVPDEEIAQWQKALNKVMASKKYLSLKQKYSNSYKAP
nr:transporter substrate-binding domain-containing protein [Bacteriovorax sp. HI3]